jgi:DNA invertase Pin-like site-specific DNA recombinase
MKIGYARVSTKEQSLENQISELEKYGCEQIFSEKYSGKSKKDRPELNNLMKMIRVGDVVCVTKLDRLGRSLMDLNDIVNKFNKKDVGFFVIDSPMIDTTSTSGRLMFSIFATFAEFERDLIAERCRVGREFAKAAGVKFGRKPIIDSDTRSVIKYLSEVKKIGWNELARRYNVSRQTIYRILKDD